jgi:hypothetical protein
MLTPSYRCSFVYLGHGHLVFPQSIRFIPSPFSGPCGAESRQRGWRLLATSRAFRFFGFGAWSLWLINTDLSARALWFPQSTFSPVLTLAGFLQVFHHEAPLRPHTYIQQATRRYSHIAA